MRNQYTETPIKLWSTFSDSSGNSSTNIRDGVQNIFAVIPGNSHNGNRRAPNPWSYNLYEYKTGSSSETIIYNDGIYNSRQYDEYRIFLTPDLMLDSAIRQAEDKAMERLYTKLRGSLDVSVDAFQARQTKRMFSLSQQYISLFKSRYSLLRKAGSSWLQYVYGWKPLAQSIFDCAEESIRFANNYVQNFTASGNVRVNHSAGTPISIGSNVYPGYMTWKGNAVVRYGCQYLIDDGTSLARFTSLNPLSIGWELLPWSFVIDWALNVGSYLRHAETALLYGSNFTSGYKTTLRAVTVSWVAGGTVKPTPSMTATGGASGSYRFIALNREILNGTPYPQPPKLNLEMGSDRLLNAASLLSQFLTTKTERTRGPRQYGPYTE